MKKRLFTIFSILFIDIFALSIVYPIFTALLLQSNNLLISDSQSWRNFYLVFLIGAFPAAQLIGAPLIGYFADRTSRKLAFFLALTGECFGLFFSGWAIHVHSYPLLVLSRLITGFFAGNLTVCLAAISDISPNQKVRSTNFGNVASVTAISFFAAGLTGGIFVKLQASLPFYIAALLCLINMGCVKWWFHPLQVVHIKSKKPLSRDVKQLYFCFLLFILAYIPFLQFLRTFSTEKFNTSSSTITLSYLSIGLVWTLSSLFMNRLLLTRFSIAGILRLSLLFFGFTLFIFQLAYNELTAMIVAPLIALFAALIWTNALTLLSTLGPQNKQGELLGINQ